MPDFAQRLRHEIVLWLLSVGGTLPLIMLFFIYPIVQNAPYTFTSPDSIGWYVGTFSIVLEIPYFLFPIFVFYHVPNMIFYCLRLEHPIERFIYEYPIFIFMILFTAFPFAVNLYKFQNCIGMLHLERLRGIKIIYENGDPCHWDMHAVKIGQNLYVALAVIVSIRTVFYLYSYFQQKHISR